jgi:hypothetical protein
VLVVQCGRRGAQGLGHREPPHRLLSLVRNCSPSATNGCSISGDLMRWLGVV